MTCVEGGGSEITIDQGYTTHQSILAFSFRKKKNQSDGGGELRKEEEDEGLKGTRRWLQMGRSKVTDMLQETGSDLVGSTSDGGSKLGSEEVQQTDGQPGQFRGRDRFGRFVIGPPLIDILIRDGDRGMIDRQLAAIQLSTD